MVMLRDLLRRDLREVRSFATTAVVYVSDGAEGEGDIRFEDRAACDGNARVAEDESGLLGYARTLVRSRPRGGEAELTSLLIAPRAREWAVDRLLVDDARREASARGVTLMCVLVRPPVDVFFRGLGAVTCGIVDSWNEGADPRIHLELPCPP